MALCNFCRLDCCSCSGCQILRTSSGIECCSKCISIAEKSIQPIQNTQNTMSTQEILIASIQKILESRRS